jgi:hypothetical protein
MTKTRGRAPFPTMHWSLISAARREIGGGGEKHLAAVLGCYVPVMRAHLT